MSIQELISLCGLGLVAGFVGGLAGLGGSILILPGLALLFGYSTQSKLEQHVYMAAAMCVNVAVAVPATIKHRAKGVIPRDVLLRTLPGQMIGVVAGAILSGYIDAGVLIRILGVIIAISVVFTWLRDRLNPAKPGEPPKLRFAALSSTSATTGFLSGLVGLGGGALVVVGLQTVARVPLTHAIGVSSAMICVTSFFGAIVKMLTLPGLEQSPTHALFLAAAMIPGALVGSHLGASATHAIPGSWLKNVIGVMMMLIAIRLMLR